MAERETRQEWTVETLLLDRLAMLDQLEFYRRLTNWMQSLLEAYVKDTSVEPPDLTTDERDLVTAIRSAPEGGVRFRLPEDNFERPERR